jgi:hypothetical protein
LYWKLETVKLETANWKLETDSYHFNGSGRNSSTRSL